MATLQKDPMKSYKFFSLTHSGLTPRNAQSLFRSPVQMIQFLNVIKCFGRIMLYEICNTLANVYNPVITYKKYYCILSVKI